MVNFKAVWFSVKYLKKNFNSFIYVTLYKLISVEIFSLKLYQLACAYKIPYRFPLYLDGD